MLSMKSLREISKEFSILYVEDNDALRSSTADIFHDLFKEVYLAEDGSIALEKYQKYYEEHLYHIDLVISDIQMPNMNGITLSKNIFAINPKQNIVIISAYNDKEYLVELINIGVNGFMQKPLNTKDMLTTLGNVCTDMQKEKESARYIKLSPTHSWDLTLNLLVENDLVIKLTDTEQKLLQLLIQHPNETFTSLEIFDLLYEMQPEKQFSEDAIKSLIKRLRKKLPKDIIRNSPQSGYSFIPLY